MKLLDRLWLYWNNYCPKHVVKKEIVFIGALVVTEYCPVCIEVDANKFQTKVARLRKGSGGQ